MIRWSILVLTMPRRRELLGRLLAGLVPQLQPVRGEVELLVNVFDRSMPVGENRDLLRAQSLGQYINFIDDDDVVEDDYVREIFPRLDGMVDYVGFNIEQTFDNSQLGCIERHSIGYRGVYSDGTGAYDGHFRDLSHLNPMRRELALRVPMTGYPGEDSRWAEELRALRVVKTEHYINKVLYHYLTRTHKPEMVNA